MHNLLRIEGITKNYGLIRALSDISFELTPGEIHCLVGENGAGKSTLIKILSGAIVPDAGVIEIFGNTYKHLTPAAARKLGIETIYQENIVCPDISAMENIYLGIEKKKGLLIDYKATKEAAQALVMDMGVEIDVTLEVAKLSGAQQKIVQVLKALAQNARILILDEPTASFSKHEIDTLLSLVRRIKERGAGILFISHHLEEVAEIADRVTVLKDGVKIAQHAAGEYTTDLLITEMTGREASLFKRKRHDKSATEEPVLEIRGFSRRQAVKNVSFSLKKGEILGFSGIVGSGRSELARLIVGADKKDAGQAYLHGKPVSIRNPKHAIRNGICLLPEDRKRHGNISWQSIADNIMIGRLNAGKSVFRRMKQEAATAKTHMGMLKIKAPGEKTRINDLSGGNQQKVIVARWLLANCEIMIFDEPTRGIDVGAKEEIYKLMNDIITEGKSIIMISSELPELLSMCDRILVMKGGELVGEVSGAEMNEQTILSISIGGGGG